MKDQLKILIKNAINEDIDLDTIALEVPKDKEHGDYSSNIAMKISKMLNKNPRDLANLIKDNIDMTNIIKVEIAGPGFINFYLKKDYLLDNINKVLKEKDEYGRSNVGNKEKINVEFVSANPTGLLHVGTSRGAAYGDSLCRILDNAGYDVTREYYFNDGGVQIENLGKSLKARYNTECGNIEEVPEDGYNGKELIDLAKKLYGAEKDKKQNEPIEYFSKYASLELTRIIKEDLNDFRVSFDVWTSEQSIRNSGNIEKCLEILRNNGDLYEEEGATFFKTTKYGDDKDRVIIKSDGNYTYLVPDIAYHLDKINRGFTEIIDVLGADHHGYIGRLKASVEALGHDKNKIHIKMLQMVRLLRNGQEVKMSKRTGLTVTMRELIDEVGTDAARYFFAMRSLDTQMDFDIDLAKKKSNENPVYYICYAHARICAILNTNEIIDFNEKYKFETIKSDLAYNVLAKVYEFQEVAQKCALRKEIHLIANYVYDLASAFHSYYGNEKIITDNEKETKERLMLINAVKIVIANSLRLIGVQAPEKM